MWGSHLTDSDLWCWYGLEVVCVMDARVDVEVCPPGLMNLGRWIDLLIFTVCSDAGLCS